MTTPFALDPYVPAGVLCMLTGAEVGYLYRLLTSAWSALPPCRLPGPVEGLAIVAGAGAAEWAASSVRVMRAFRTDADGGYTAVELLARFNALTAIRRARAEAGRLGADATNAARSAGAAANARQVPRQLPTSAALDVRGRAPVRAERSESALALQRSLRYVDLSAHPDGADSAARAGSAGARAPEDRRGEDERARVHGKLGRARFPWAGSRADKLPARKVDELAGLPWATEMLVDFVIDRVGADRPGNAIGFIFRAMGWDKHAQRWGKPWDVALTYRLGWERKRDEVERVRARIAENQARIDASKHGGGAAAGAGGTA